MLNRSPNPHDDPEDIDKSDSRRTRLTAEIAAKINAALAGGRQAHRVFTDVYSHANTAALRGDRCPAEALRDYLCAYLPALRDHRFGRRDWTAMSLSMQEMRLLQATRLLCSEGDNGKT
jgi:hypothetical protein